MKVKYWGQTYEEEDVELYFVATRNGGLITLLCEIFMGLEIWRMGPCVEPGPKDIILSRWFEEQSIGYVRVTPEEYEAFYIASHHSWIVDLEEHPQLMLSVLRRLWLPNREIAEHENIFFKYLGYNEFHPSKHRYLSETGHLPPIVEHSVER